MSSSVARSRLWTIRSPTRKLSPSISVEGPALRDLLDREVELVARHEVDRLRRAQRRLRSDGDVRADEADAEARVGALERLGDADVGAERGRARVQDGELVLGRERERRPRARARGPARRRAGSRARVPPAARARSDTRTSGSRASPGSASRRRRRIPRRTAGSGRASSGASCAAPALLGPRARNACGREVAPARRAWGEP